MTFLLLVVFSFRAAAQDHALRQAARLDSEQKCAEAERIYQQVLAQRPPSTSLFNNAGNHYVVCGDAEKARFYFERVLKLNPQHGNANLQLARFAVERRQGTRALEYLARVNDAQPSVRLLRAEALHWAGKPAAAAAMLDVIKKQIGGEERLLFLYGLACARIGAYAKAEAAFNSVLARHPDDFDLLFHLGRAAAHGGNYDRARRALEVAVKLRPENIDAIAELGQVYAASQDYARAIFLLAKARQLAPQNTDVLLALARAAQSGEYYGDAAIAYDEYLRLKPGDEAARRDRSLVCAHTEARQSEGRRDLTDYVRKHPDDAMAHHGLAQLLWRDQPQEALAHLTQAVKLDRKFAAAYINRAWLLNRLGQTEAAVADLLKALEIDPRDSRALDQLGLAYSSLDRPEDAEKVLRRALAVAPENPDILMHLGRTLIELGQDNEAQQYLARFEKVRPQRARGPWKQAGMIESASLPAAERTKREIERLRRDANAHPDDPELQFRLAGLLLADGRNEEASKEFGVLLGRNAGALLWQQAGSFLLGFEQFELARQFLERAAAASPGANLDLAIALHSTNGPSEALKALERIPESERLGDYLVMKAGMLELAGQSDESRKVLDQGLRLAISRPQVYRHAALLLVRQNRKSAALALLNRAGETNADLLLTRALVLGLMEQHDAAEKTLKEIESRWPEWDRPYLVHGLLLERTQPRVAAQKLRTAAALGSRDRETRCALSRMSKSGDPDPECSCAGGLYELIFSPCKTLY